MTSPCKEICTLDARGKFCVGCFRTLEELTNWYKLPFGDKERIINECKQREVEYANASKSRIEGAW